MSVPGASITDVTSDETPPETDDKQNRDAYWDRRNALQPDMMLATIVQTIERTGSRIPLTLTISGAIVTGMAVRRRDWLRSLSESASGFEPILDPFADLWAKQEAEDAAEDVKDSGQSPYHAMVHLADARHVLSGQMVPEGGSFWRGRLSEVSGWSIGQLAVTAG